jgi:hypothetical protein
VPAPNRKELLTEFFFFDTVLQQLATSCCALSAIVNVLPHGWLLLVCYTFWQQAGADNKANSRDVVFGQHRATKGFAQKFLLSGSELSATPSTLHE